MAFYRRNLPHWKPQNASVFVTWCLEGAQKKFVRAKQLSEGERFGAMDLELDQASVGPRWLLDERVAECVKSALDFGEQQLRLYSLLAYVIMPNHVHVVIKPNAELARITQVVKGF